jgi:hypothetical protein
MAAKKEVGKGRKTCPECGEVLGARAGECKKCHHKFPVKTKAPKGGLDIRQQITKVKELGGTAKVQKMIEAAKAASSALDSLGGLAQAEDAIALVNELKAL